MDVSQPNVLLILTDQQPVSTLGCYGNPVVQTPAQDRITRFVDLCQMALRRRRLT